MRRWPIPIAALALMIASSWTLIAFAAADQRGTVDPRAIPHIARSGSGTVISSHSSGENLSKAVADTVYLLGGPGTAEGKFQTIDGGNGGLPDAQGWTGFDRTETQVFWNVSTFNAQNFTGAAGNRAIWSGVPAGTPGFQTAPGYGNNWDDQLIYTQVSDPAVSHSVRLRFEYNYDTEPGYDFFTVDYDSAGFWTNLLSVSGTNADGSGNFLTPAIFDQTVALSAGALGGNTGNQIRLRIRFQSDGAASDEDPFFDSIAGACQVDNIDVFVDGALVSRADFEGAAGDADWVPEKAPFVGDFAKIYTQFSDTDPCRSNATPQFGFVDDGTPPSNGNGISTGGQTSPNWSYGVPGSWVVNHNGGLTFGELDLWDEIQSPVIPWDLPGTDDDAAVGAAFFRISLWEHLPLANGLFWIWQVRSQDQAGNWTPWVNRNLVIFEDLQVYSNSRDEIGDLLVADPQAVQLSLGVIDLADVFQLPGGDATPAPFYDNVALARYRVTGPSITVRNFDLFQDSFPNSGSIDATDPLSMQIRLDAAQDIVRTAGVANVAGDSIVATIQPAVPGTALAGPPTLRWVLDANPLFDGVRVLPAGASLLGTFTGRDGRTWNRWSGAVAGQLSTNAGGSVVDGNWFFDLPDGKKAASAVGQTDEDPLFFAGDVLRYHLEAQDDAGNITTLPADLTGYVDGSWGIAGRLFTVHGLPSLLDGDGDGIPSQPSILVINDFGRRGGENDFVSAFSQNGMVEGIHYDTYTVQGPDSQVSNGIGSAGVHGANSQQLKDYSTIFYFAGDLTSTLSDGITANDKGNDVQVLTQWHDLPGDRHMVYFGDYIAAGLLALNSSGLTYLNTVMGVDFVDNDLNAEIGGQSAPVVAPTADAPALFSSTFVAFGGCLGINQFDSIRPITGAVRSHEFLGPFGETGLYGPAAAIWYDRQQVVGVDSFRRVDVTFPFGFVFLWDAVSNKAPNGASARSRLVAELLTAFNEPFDDGNATPAPTPVLRTELAANQPNPFNPSTTIRFRIGEAGRYRLRVYNIKGELVRTLVDGPLEAGDRSVVWNGKDTAGRTVSSGVYLYRLSGNGFEDTRKMTILK